MTSRSVYWSYFTKDPVDPEVAVCKLCSAKISRKGSSTSGMANHIKNRHRSIDVSKQPSSALGQSVSVQQTLLQSMSRSTTQVRRPLRQEESERLRRSLAWMCAVDIRPISIVDGVGFRNYSRLLNPNFVLPTRRTLTSYVHRIYQEGHEELKQDIAGSAVGLTTDLWTSNAQEGYITLTAQYITAQWEQRTKVLATRVLKDRHTGEKISEAIKEITREFGIPRITAICTDNAANMKTCCQHGEFTRIPCFAHTLQLGINDGLKMGHQQGSGRHQTGVIQRALAKARRLITFFNHSVPGRHCICLTYSLDELI